VINEMPRARDRAKYPFELAKKIHAIARLLAFFMQVRPPTILEYALFYALIT